jgi:hypothetical protein
VIIARIAIAAAGCVPLTPDALRRTAGALRHIGQSPSVTGLLRILTHRYVGDVPPELQLQLATNAFFGVQIAGIEPCLPQLFEARGRGPAIPAIDPIAAQAQIASRCEIGGAVEEGEEYVPASLLDRLLAATSPDHGAEIHRLNIDVHAALAQRVHANKCQRVDH